MSSFSVVGSVKRKRKVKTADYGYKNRSKSGRDGDLSNIPSVVKSHNRLPRMTRSTDLSEDSADSSSSIEDSEDEEGHTEPLDDYSLNTINFEVDGGNSIITPAITTNTTTSSSTPLPTLYYDNKFENDDSSNKRRRLRLSDDSESEELSEIELAKQSLVGSDNNRIKQEYYDAYRSKALLTDSRESDNNSDDLNCLRNSSTGYFTAKSRDQATDDSVSLFGNSEFSSASYQESSDDSDRSTSFKKFRADDNNMKNIRKNNTKYYDSNNINNNNNTNRDGEVSSERMSRQIQNRAKKTTFYKSNNDDDDDNSDFRQTSEENLSRDDINNSNFESRSVVFYGDSQTSRESKDFDDSKNRSSNDTDYSSSSISCVRNATNKSSDSEQPVYSEVSKRMMMNMGYKEGKGLGSNEQGRVVPIKESTQKGRRGLGLKQIASILVEYDSNKEIYSVEEEVDWLDCDNAKYTQYDITNTWALTGDKIRSLDDQTDFCDQNILKMLLECKTSLDKIPDEEMRRARSRSNPFEKIKNCIFLNRAAMKMANLDFVTDYMFTTPRNRNNEEMVNSSQLLYFADVCAGPGGFSEYVLYRAHGWRAKGFGFTLKEAHDFELDNFYAAPCESFEPHYGAHNDGDIYKPDNIDSFAKYVLKHTDGEGVHFMMADGGFSVEGEENIQEILSKRLYLCQCLVALRIVRTEGHFICKLFDVFTRFSVGLVFLMHLAFHKVSIHKPRTSRPANSERYLICKWKKDNVENIIAYLSNLNVYIERSNEDTKEINELVPMDVLKDEENFYNYVYTSNNKVGEYQINSLAKLIAFWHDDELVENSQIMLKKKCLELYRIPSDVRKEPEKECPETVCRKLFDNVTAFLNRSLNICKQSEGTLMSLFPVFNWHSTFLCSDRAKFYVCTGRKRCYEYDMLAAKWNPVNPDFNLELSPKTFLFGEIVSEFIGERMAQRRVNVLHIIDACHIGDLNIRHLHYTDRIKYCQLYAKAISKEYVSTTMPVKVKPVISFEDVGNLFSKLKRIEMKKAFHHEFAYAWEDGQFFIPKGLIFLKTTKHPYDRFLSKTFNQTFYTKPNSEALFERDRPLDAVSDFVNTYKASQIWYGKPDTNLAEQAFIPFILSYVAVSKPARNFSDVPFSEIKFSVESS